MKITIFYFIVTVIISFSCIQPLKSQNTINYWTIDNNSITVKTKNSLGQITNSKSYTVNNNTFNWNNYLIYLKPSVLASYPYGEEKLNKLIKDYLDCTECEGMIRIGVYVCLIISDTGVIKDIGIMRSGGFENDVNVVSFFNKISLFKPATNNGSPVHSLIIWPVRFFGN